MRNSITNRSALRGFHESLKINLPMSNQQPSGTAGQPTPPESGHPPTPDELAAGDFDVARWYLDTDTGASD